MAVPGATWCSVRPSTEIVKLPVSESAPDVVTDTSIRPSDETLMNVSPHPASTSPANATSTPTPADTEFSRRRATLPRHVAVPNLGSDQ
jgi:hypothetical protein